MVADVFGSNHKIGLRICVTQSEGRRVKKKKANHACSNSPPLIKMHYMVRDGLPKKGAILLNFVQITLTPPPSPQFGQLVPLFLTPICQTISAVVTPSLPIPKLTQYIQFVKSGQKNLGSPPHLIWTKSKRTATFFRETIPKTDTYDIHTKKN